MPFTREEHVEYTKKEYNELIYYKNMFDILIEKKVKSYIDIGANIGEVCNIYFEKIPSLKTAYLFEPDIDNYKFLLNNIKFSKNIIAYNKAIYYGKNSPKLFQNFNPGGFIVSDSNPNKSFFDSNQKIEYTTLEDLNLSNIDLIKIDIEGGEFELIENSKYIHTVPYIEIEFHYDNNSLDIKKYLKDNIPNHVIVLIEDIEGRVLLERKDLNDL